MYTETCVKNKDFLFIGSCFQRIFFPYYQKIKLYVTGRRKVKGLTGIKCKGSHNTLYYGER